MDPINISNLLKLYKLCIAVGVYWELNVLEFFCRKKVTEFAQSCHQPQSSGENIM